MSRSLRQLVRHLAATPSERAISMAAMVHLIRDRRRLLPLLRMVPSTRSAKLRLWRALAVAAMASRADGGRHDPTSSTDPAEIADLQKALWATQAWRDAQASHLASCSSPFGRGLNYSALLAQWRRQPPERLLIFHHHDRRGLLPRSWFQALIAARAAGWTVVLSSSDLAPPLQRQLEQEGVLLALRRNVGLCLGAYKDLCLLLQVPAVAQALRSLVLANDSTLPVAAEAAFTDQLQAWVNAFETTSTPVLAGLTDSAERGRYHLQSYLLYANRALVGSLAWQRFWLGFSPCGSKDELINRGEIGLSQTVLAAGGSLQPAYPLIEALLNQPAMAAELQSYRVWQPTQINPTLFAWQSLLARGFPLVKKHALFDLAENEGQPMALAALAAWLAPERRALLSADLHELFISRYSFQEPDVP